MKLRFSTILALAGSLILAPYAFSAQEAEQKQDSKSYSQQQTSTSDQQNQTRQKESATAGQQDQSRQQKQTATNQQQSRYAQQLLTADKLNGMQIQNQQGEDIGSVDQVILDAKEGKLAYVVVSTGGLWGIGGQKAIVPWNALHLQSEQALQRQTAQQQGQAGQQGQTAQQGQAQQGQQVLVLNVQKDQLKNAPQGDLQNVLDRQQGVQIHKFYGVAPYWESGQEGSQQQNLPPGHQSKEMRGQQEPPGHQPKEEGSR